MKMSLMDEVGWCRTGAMVVVRLFGLQVNWVRLTAPTPTNSPLGLRSPSSATTSNPESKLRPAPSLPNRPAWSKQCRTSLPRACLTLTAGCLGVVPGSRLCRTSPSQPRPALRATRHRPRLKLSSAAAAASASSKHPLVCAPLLPLLPPPASPAALGAPAPSRPPEPH